MDLSKLIPDAANARLHPEKNEKALADSLKRFGPARSIVIDGKNVVRAGNGTLKAAAEAGITKVKIVDAKPGELIAVRRRDWSDSEATAYAIADNRTAELGAWDYDVLSQQLADFGVDGLVGTGFDADDLKAFAGDSDWFEPDAGEPLDNVTAEDQPTKLVILVDESDEVAHVKAAILDMLQSFNTAKLL